ncbi:MAG TPA: hypothetical protein PKD64_12340 [Pirellulaceae bacterium]|nr:hypothetical protein [Pirellulaceae bacterium]HMO92976.1 hypothetical protein [Pirellulaceae bacterium]HMP67945.1 hypothetical protein [Pirellulaceae bacterium]
MNDHRYWLAGMRGLVRTRIFGLPIIILAFGALLFTNVHTWGQEQDKKDRVKSDQFSMRLSDEFYVRYAIQLNAQLKTRLEAEELFVNDVVELVRQGKIPKPVVDQAWLWVHSNRGASRYPFVYFEQVLRLQCDKLKLELPEFDRRIYSSARPDGKKPLRR